MYKPVKCPQCGHEFTPVRTIKSGAWTPEEDELLLNGYKKERKTIAELSDELNRSQDATRNRLFVLRGGGKPKGVTAINISAIATPILITIRSKSYERQYFTRY